MIDMDIMNSWSVCIVHPWGSVYFPKPISKCICFVFFVIG